MTTEYAFYQVKGATPAAVEAVLPKILWKVLEREQKALVVCPSFDRMRQIDEALWSYEDISFLPHGRVDDPQPEGQTILISDKLENVNKAQILIGIGDALQDLPESLVASVEKVSDVFDSSDAQTQKARGRWKRQKEQGAALSYFQQTEKGWQKKH